MKNDPFDFTVGRLVSFCEARFEIAKNFARDADAMIFLFFMTKPSAYAKINKYL